MFEFQPTPLTGAFVIEMPKFKDERGDFTKTFHHSSFLKENLDFDLKESYFSFSNLGVIRGMHFQKPPHQHAKIVFCPVGTILDVLLDLRKESPTYLQSFSIELSSDNHKAIFIPEGFAHGFQALKDNSMTFYLVSSEYNPENDTGIKWDSFDFPWNNNQPIISKRDRSFPDLTSFNSPF